MVKPNQDPHGSRAELAAKDADRLRNAAADRLKLANECAHGALKGLFIANGGAIIALLTFVGNAKIRVPETSDLRCGFELFSSGLAAVLMAYVAGYVSHAFYMQAEFNLSSQADSKAYQTGEEFDHLAHERRGNCAESIGIGLAILSLILFVGGAFAALDAIT